MAIKLRKKTGTNTFADPITLLESSDLASWAKASSKPTYTASEVGALPLSGGTMTGNISYRTTNFTSTPLAVYDDGTAYGQTLVIGASGTSYVGAGESPSALRTALNVNSTENLYLSADNAIYLFSYCDTIANRKGICIDTSGNFYPVTNKGFNLGTSSYSWNNLYATVIYENGTALSAKYQAKGTYAGTAVATTSSNGLMSSTDKTRLDNIYTVLNGSDASKIDTIAEVYAFLEDYAQTTDLAALLANKLDKTAKAADSDKLGGQLPAYYTPKDAIDLTGQTVSLLTLVKALGTSGTQYAKYICKTDGGSANITGRPTTNNAGFVCEVLCNRWVNTADYRYILRYYQQNDTNAFLSEINQGTTTISWTRTNTNTDTQVSQVNSTTTDYRPIILGNSSQSSPSSFADIVSNVNYSKSIYVQPSSGTIYATAFNENGTSLASKYLGISSKAADSSKLNGQEASYYLNYNNLSNKPTIDNNNQKVKAGSVTFDANDTVNFAGSGIVSVTGDATNDAITISASHQSIKTLKTDNTTAQSTSSSEAIAGSGTINLHKVAKTGTYSDLISKPTLGTAAAKNYTTSVTQNSNDLVTSGAVYTAIENAIITALNTPV